MTDTDASRNGLKALVVQTGARRGYALPRMLEEAGCLHSFHTTTAFREGGGIFKSLAVAIAPSRKSSIDRRTVRSIPPGKVYSNTAADIARFRAIRRDGSALSGRLAQSHELGRKTIPHIGEGANVAFLVDDSGGPELMKALRAKGIPIAVDIVVTPMAHEMTSAAAEEWPEWKTTVYSPAERARYLEMYEETVGLVDLVMYPSQGVLEGLRQLKNFDEAKSRHVPYALGALEPMRPQPERGRILFAGSDPVRKGLPYLAQAARELTEMGYAYEFIIAGAIPEQIRQLEDCRELTFLGHISRDEMSRQLSRADVFCLPSLAEGTAAVTLEALASGLPCIVTPSAGAPVTDRHNGLIVEERNSSSIRDAILNLVEDRPLRQSLSDAAIAGRDSFSRSVIQKKLVSALSSLL